MGIAWYSEHAERKTVLPVIPCHRYPLRISSLPAVVSNGDAAKPRAAGRTAAARAQRLWLTFIDEGQRRGHDVATRGGDDAGAWQQWQMWQHPSRLGSGDGGERQCGWWR